MSSKINIMSLPIDVLEKCLCKSSINKFIQNEVFNKNIKNFLLNMIKDNTFNNKLIKISILQDLNDYCFEDAYTDNENLEWLFILINKMNLSTINNILNKYTKNDIWHNNVYYCMNNRDYLNLYYEDFIYDDSNLRNTEYIKKIFKNFINYAENKFLSIHYNEPCIYENQYDLIDELISNYIFNLDYEEFIFNYGITNVFNDFDDEFDIIDYLKDEDGLESIVFRIFKEYIKSNLNEFYDYNQFIEIINYKNYLYNKLYK